MILEENPSKRLKYLDVLDRIIKTAYVKYQGMDTENKARLSWGRLIVQAVKVGNSILRDLELDELKVRIVKLEEVSKK